MKEKEYKTIGEQLEILQENKNVKITNYNLSFEYLQKNAYYNFINSTKIHFKDYKSGGYKLSTFEEWTNKYEENKQIELKLLQLCLQQEEILTIHIVDYLTTHSHESEVSKRAIACSHNLSTLKEIRGKNKMNEKQANEYFLSNSWRFVHEFGLGNKISILEKMEEEDKQKLNMLSCLKCNDKSELKEFKNLRNSLAHNTPLNIYLTTGNPKIRNKRIKIINKIANLKGSGIKEQVKINIDVCKKYKKAK